MLCFRDQAVPALSDTALLANPSCCSLVKCFMSINVGMFYEVHTQPMIYTAPPLLLLLSFLEIKVCLKPLLVDPSGLRGCSTWLAVTAGSSGKSLLRILSLEICWEYN